MIENVKARMHLKCKPAELCTKCSFSWLLESCFYSRAFLWTPAVSDPCIRGRQLLFILPSTVLNLPRWLSWWKVCWDISQLPRDLHRARRGPSLGPWLWYSFLAKAASFGHVDLHICSVLSGISGRRECSPEIAKSPFHTYIKISYR